MERKRINKYFVGKCQILSKIQCRKVNKHLHTELKSMKSGNSWIPGFLGIRQTKKDPLSENAASLVSSSRSLCSMSSSEFIYLLLFKKGHPYDIFQ